MTPGEAIVLVSGERPCPGYPPASDLASSSRRRWDLIRTSARQLVRSLLLTIWGPGAGRAPFPAQPGSATLRVSDELGKETRDVCLRWYRRAPQAFPGGGGR